MYHIASQCIILHDTTRRDATRRDATRRDATLQLHHTVHHTTAWHCTGAREHAPLQPVGPDREGRHELAEELRRGHDGRLNRDDGAVAVGHVTSSDGRGDDRARQRGADGRLLLPNGEECDGDRRRRPAARGPAQPEIGEDRPLAPTDRTRRLASWFAPQWQSRGRGGGTKSAGGLQRPAR